MSASQVRERLLAERHIASAEDISLTSIRRVARNTGLAEAHRLLGQIFKFTPDGQVLCPHCGSSLIARKENAPRSKKYRDPEMGQWRRVEGYRCYCLDPSCSFDTFTDYPTPSSPI